MTTTIDPMSLCNWSAPREVQTKFGPRILRTAAPSEEFSALWKANKEAGTLDAVKSLGLGWSKDKVSGEWTVTWWAPIPKEEADARHASAEASRALDANIDIPCNPGLEYRPFQKAGIAYMARRFAVLLGDEMGVGKTIQAIGRINVDPGIKRVLVIAPAVMKITWRNELRKWLVRPMTIGVASGSTLPDADVVVINYDIITRHRDALAAVQWDLIVCDECHQIKNPNALRTKVICGHVDKATKERTEGLRARFKVAMTGTPILNATQDMFPVLNWLDERSWPNRYKFIYRYGNGQRLDELQRKLRESIMIRRLKRDVLPELPSKVRSIVLLEADGYEGVLANERAALAKAEASRERIEDLQVKLALAKAADNDEDYHRIVSALKECGQVAFEEISRVRHETAVAKIPAVLEHVRSVLDGNGKVIVFAHHHDVVDGLVSGLKDYGPVKIVGGMPDQSRQASMERFQSDPKTRVAVCSIRASGVGLTLTASSHVIFAELDWVPGINTQAEDRAHRIGQKSSVNIEHVILDGSLDQRMAEICIEKQAISDAALDAPSASPDPVEIPWAPRSNEPRPCVIPSREQIAAEGHEISDEQREAIHSGLKILAGVCDGAHKKDECGFNGCDSRIGRSLAMQPRLTNRQAALGRRICRKYHRQIGWELVQAMGAKGPTE